MAAVIIGSGTWTRIPGGSESSGDDGSFTVTRMYNGAITGWEAFRAANPPGTADPIYGNTAFSTAYPSVTEARNMTYVASITFSGGTFEPGKDTTKPNSNITFASKELEVKHPDSGKKVGLNYTAVQTTIRYTKKGTPNKAGEMQALADTTAPIETSPPILQNLPDEDDELSNAQISTLVNAVSAPWLEGFDANQRVDEGGNILWDVTETWVMGLENA